MLVYKFPLLADDLELANLAVFVLFVPLAPFVLVSLLHERVQIIKCDVSQLSQPLQVIGQILSRHHFLMHPLCLFDYLLHRAHFDPQGYELIVVAPLTQLVPSLDLSLNLVL